MQGLGVAHVQWLVQNQLEGAKAQGTPHLGSGKDHSASREAPDPFRPSKESSVTMPAAPKGRAPVIPEQSGITLLHKSGVVNFQLGSAKGVFEQASVLPAVSPGRWKLG